MHEEVTFFVAGVKRKLSKVIDNSFSRSDNAVVTSKHEFVASAILANSYSDIIVTNVWRKKCNFRLAFLEFPSVKFHKSWQIGYNCFDLHRARENL